MFSNKIFSFDVNTEQEFFLIEYKTFYLNILNKYIGENFFRRDDHFFIKNNTYVNRMVKGYGLSGIDVDDLVGQIFVWFCSALEEYNFEELITEDFNVERDAYVYNKIKSELHNYLKYLRVRYRPIPKNKQHKLEKNKNDYAPVIPKIEIDLSVLNADEKTVIDSYFLEDVKVKEIAQKLGKSEKTVKRIKSQALKKLYATNALTE